MRAGRRLLVILTVKGEKYTYDVDHAPLAVDGVLTFTEAATGRPINYVLFNLLAWWVQ